LCGEARSVATNKVILPRRAPLSDCLGLCEQL
jgi:hypothetical protein